MTAACYLLIYVQGNGRTEGAHGYLLTELDGRQRISLTWWTQLMEKTNKPSKMATQRRVANDAGISSSSSNSRHRPRTVPPLLVSSASGQSSGVGVPVPEGGWSSTEKTGCGRSRWTSQMPVPLRSESRNAHGPSQVPCRLSSPSSA